MKLKFLDVRTAIALIFIGFFLAASSLSISQLLTGSVYQDSLLKLMLKVTSLYSVHLGVILGGFFSEGNFEQLDKPDSVYVLALLGCTCWNLLVVWRFFLFAFTNDEVADVISYIDSYPQNLSFLVTFSLTYLFIKRKASA